ncbi:putative bifunctional diguanylate cyclase/phosphodiesterase, partial [Salinivibrio socompensis]|uniref:putative bifunctional diguanylate cyclase/phosphodiesterase n=1 Tax=Salinivibrio socompensis TaxID=1510206 RepID=UPI0004701EE8
LMLALALTMILFSLALAERFRFQRMQEMRSLTHDTLSCLPNNNVLHMVISDLISRNHNFNLCCLSIDNYNNLLPYLDERARNEYINAIAARINDTLAVQAVQAIKTDSDMPNYRLGCLKEGIFAFLIADVDRVTCDQVLTAVVDNLSGDLCVGSFVTQVNARIGVCHYPTDGDHPGLLISRALHAIDQHRPIVGSYAHFNSYEHRHHQLHVSLINDLRSAIENDGLELYHQPQIDLRTGSIHGSEVLARWTHPEYGQISPDVFVRMAEDVGIINSLTLWVIKRAFQQQAQLIERGHCRRLSINISASDIYIPDLAGRVVELAGEYNIPTNLISLELTESVMVEDYNWLKQLITKLSTSGIEVSIDDYGTGYSSLYFLSQLPFTELKIDRSFVRDLPKSRRHQSIVRATTDMAQSLGVMVVAEGVESEEAEALLRRYGVDISQGYYYSRPLPFNQYQAYVDRMGSVQPKTMIYSPQARSSSG